MKLRRIVRRLSFLLVRSWLGLEFREQSGQTMQGHPTRLKESKSLMLGIGPTNTAGLGHAWAQALREKIPDVAVESFGLVPGGPLKFPCDRPVTQAEWNSRRWQLGQARRVLLNYTHLLAESGLSIFGSLNGRFFDDDLAMIESAGIQVALVFHGSEIRDPDRHAEMEAFSPFRDVSAEADQAWHARVQRLRENSAEVRSRAQRFSRLPIFVTTLGLQDDIPEARWLPAVIDTKKWHQKHRILMGRRPVVLHLPSNSRLKGSDYVDRICIRLQERGLIDYLRPPIVPPTDVPELLNRADVLVDGLVLGDGPSVTACQAFACGLTVVGHVSERVRSRIPGELPIVEATPLTLGEVVTRLAQDRTRWDDLAVKGRDYFERFHSGPYSAGVLETFVNT